MELRRQEILRYLGAGNEGDCQLNALIDSCQHELLSIARPRHVYKITDPAEHGELCQGRAIRRHLQGARRWLILAVTLGAAVDRLIDRYQVTRLSRALVLNACATEAVEALCRDLETVVRQDRGAAGLLLGPRFSPGYGDYPLEVQPRLLRILNADIRIGLTCTESFFLIPKKSVTALAALRDREGGGAKPDCRGCPQNEGCPYRKGEEHDH